MTKNLAQRIVAGVLILAAVALIVVGVIGVGRRTAPVGQQFLDDMRIRAVLDATGAGAVESYVAIAKKEATAAAKASGGGMKAIREAVEKAEADARANYTGSLIDYATTDVSGLREPIVGLDTALEAYYNEEAAAQAAFLLEKGDTEPEIAADAVPDASMSAEGGDVMAEDIPLETEAQPDLTDFVATPRMMELRAEADSAYMVLGEALKGVYEALDDEAIKALQGTVETIVYQRGDTYTSRYDRYQQNGGSSALSDRQMTAWVTRFGDDIITIGVAMIILALLVLFYQKLVKGLGIPRLIIGMFFVLLCVLAVIYDLTLPTLLSNTIVRFGMNAVMVLAMVPGIQCGISLNLGLPVGILGGLLAGIMSIEFNIRFGLGFWYSIVVGALIAAVLGYLYGLLLNKLKGSEMAVTTYVGYSFVSLMCIAWIMLPFKSLELRWPLGMGLRNTFTLGNTYRHYLDNFWKFKIGDLTIPTGLLLFVAVCCLLVWLFTRSKTGIAMKAAGSNPRFAEATGVNVDKMRIIGTVLSTVLGAIGIIVYSQSYGFMQIYTAPRQMGFIAASAILIGGASTSRCKISHVIIGTFLFQGVLTLGMPVANVLVPQSTISETMRILISNGIILYALTKSGGEIRA